MQACFGAGTPIVVDHEGGSWPIEDLRVGDFILTRDEYNSTRALVLRRVEGIFARLGRVLHLHLGQQTIRTTAEHPFWVVNQNTWLPAGSLHQGDILLSHTGQQVAVEEVYDTGEWETVYNLRVEDYHTYFVGGADWGFSVWAHNDYAQRMSAKEKDGFAKQYAKDVKKGRATDWGELTPKQQRAIREHAVQQGYVDESLLHGNSLSTNAKARGYTLRDKDTGEILKYGETTLPGTSRYSQTYLDENNARMFFEASGTKRAMHSWQNRMILDHVEQFGQRPLLNRSNY